MNTIKNKNLDGVKFFGQPVVNMTADKLLEVIGYLVEENQRLRDRAERRMEIMNSQTSEKLIMNYEEARKKYNKLHE